ncbi:MAG: electron transport complex subunit RsxE [Bacilli bacterium]|nr:electron transport complex subunit RsxE [Bacilli bacterium]
MKMRMKIRQQLKEGLFTRNPVLVQQMGLCPVLAVSTSLCNGIGMGLSVLAVLLCSSVIVALLRKIIPDRFRVLCCIAVTAIFTTAAGQLLQSFFPPLSDRLGIYVPLIALNSMILSRTETFAFRSRVDAAAVDGAVQALGYAMALLLLCAVRELLGSGTLGGGLLGAGGTGIRILPEGAGLRVLVLPAGGFLTLAVLIAATQYILRRMAEKNAAAEKEAEL